MNTLVIISCILPSFIIIYILWLKNTSLKKEQDHASKKMNELESKLNSYELRNIDSRLNPHLLRNILNSIQSHAYQTYYSIDKLSNVLDYFLYESRKNFVSPKEEIEFTKNLIEINKIKLSPLFELNVKYKIDENDPVYTQEVLAPLISIDLIENAFKHADLQSSDSFISIVIELKEGQFSVMVSNKTSGQKFQKKENGGIGSETQQSRLNILYKNRYKLERKREDAVYIARLQLNLHNYNAEVFTAG